MQQKQNILVILGHPTRDSLCGALADAYAEGVRAGGGEAEVMHVAALNIDYMADPRSVQSLEPDAQEAQRKMATAQGIVWVYPMWWGTTPAVMKGFVDRVMTTGFAFKYRENSPFPEKLLTGKFARILLTMDSPKLWHRFAYKLSAIQWLKTATLWFTGVKVRGVHQFPTVRKSDQARREQWLKQVYLFGERDGMTKDGTRLPRFDKLRA